VPLNADREGVPSELDRLDDSIRGTRTDAQGRTWRRDGLVVETVDRGGAFAQRRGRAGAAFDYDGVSPLGLRESMLARLGQIVGEVVVKGSAVM